MTWEDAIESYKTYLILEKSLFIEFSRSLLKRH